MLLYLYNCLEILFVGLNPLPFLCDGYLLAGRVARFKELEEARPTTLHNLLIIHHQRRRRDRCDGVKIFFHDNGLQYRE